jgi:phospholipid/cholesterol/gamma-HCH transport system substrate-binding protein
MGGIDSAMKKSRLQQTAMEITVGAFVLMIVLALGFFTIILSRENIFTRSYGIDVIIPDATGLSNGDKAYLHGVDVGRVKDMTIHQDGVHVLLTLRYDMQLRRGYRITVEPSSVLGGRFVAIDPGPSTSPRIPPNEIIYGEKPVDLAREATEAVKAVRQALEEGGVLGNLRQIMTNLRNVTDKINKGEGAVGKLVNDESMYNDLKELVANLKDASDKIAKGEGSLGKLVNDDKVYNDISKIASDLKEVSDRLAQGKGTLGKLMSDDDKLYQDLSSSAASIKSITASIEKGEGTIGKLTMDQTVYNKVDKLLDDARATIDDFRETSPITSFASVFLGAF